MNDGGNSMSENNQKQDNEIDLVVLFMTIWDDKLKIIASVIVFILGAVGFLVITPSTFTAKTEIMPINSVAADNYRQFNALGFFEISPALLLNLFIEELEERSAFENAIRKFELLNRNDFESDLDYEASVERFASEIEILPPINVDGTRSGEVRRFWTLSNEYDDEKKWEDLLTLTGKTVNESVRRTIARRFELLLLQEKQKHDFELEDIATQIRNTKTDFDKEMLEFEIILGFQLEDIETKIENSYKDHERRTADRLAFLIEQAAIARELNIARNTLEAQTFDARNGVLANVETNTPFYLRGYEAIEKEIDIIKKRKTPDAFVDGLLELENEKRALEQNKTLDRAEKNKLFLDKLLVLEKAQRAIIQNKTMERAQALFKLTPVSNQEEFSATSINVNSTDFRYDRSPVLILALVAITGGLVGGLYVLIASAVKNRRKLAGAES